MKHRLKRLALGAYRLALIAGAMLCLWYGQASRPSVSPDLLLAQGRKTLPAAASLGGAENGFYPVLSENGNLLAWATTTYPQAQSIQGYSGPSELFVLLSPERSILAVEFLTSADTAGHVAKVRQDRAFWAQWNGNSETRAGAAQDVRIVSGATLTSEAMARGVAARFGAKGMNEWFPDGIESEVIRRWYPETATISPTREKGVSAVKEDGIRIGTILRSSRMGVLSRGFNGTSDVILALSADEKTMLGVALLGSRDNEPYVGYVKDELLYADGFAGKAVGSVFPPDDPPLIVSGASITAHAVILSVGEMLEKHFEEKAVAAFPWKSALSIVWIAIGLVVGFSKRLGSRKWRMGFAAISVIAGLTLGWMVSQDQLVGWGKHGISSGIALPLLVLTAVALLIPTFTGKNVYCSRICPHGAAQTILGSLVKKRYALHSRVHRSLQKLPWITLIAIWVIALAGVALPLAQAEPFEIWSSGFYAILPAAILTIGLVAAIFLPQAYCNYGCPTGALLKFLTHSPSSWTRRDSVATVLVASAIIWTAL